MMFSSGAHRHRHGRRTDGNGCDQSTPITALAPGQSGRVVDVGGAGMSRHLASLGIYTGTRLRLVRGGSGHAAIVEVGGTRLVVGRGMAPRILVEPEAEDSVS